MRRQAEAFPVGEYLADELDARGWDTRTFSEIIGKPVAFVREILNGERKVTLSTAVPIGHALGTGPEIWANLDMAYRKWAAKQGEQR